MGSRGPGLQKLHQQQSRGQASNAIRQNPRLRKTAKVAKSQSWNKQSEKQLATQSKGSEECYPALKNPPRDYGFWSASDPNLDPLEIQQKPRVLILFSGRSRKRNLHQQFARRGWVACSVDLVAPRPTNILADDIWTAILKDLKQGYFEVVWAATPCETFSPLREKQPGPRPLRSAESIMGLPKEQLTRAEQKQVKESNILVFKTAEALNTQHALGKAYGLENPDHQVGKPSLWLMPHIKAILDKKDVIEVNFDHFRVGLHTTKPTKPPSGRPA